MQHELVLTSAIRLPAVCLMTSYTLCHAEQLEKQARENELRAQIAIEKSKLLPPEVQEDWPGPTMTCMVRWPDGSRHQRRFRQEDPVSQIFDFVDSKVWLFLCSFDGF